MTNQAAEIAQNLREAASDGKISCAAAHALAERLGISLTLLGETANQLGIKIRACQLGCFK